MALRAKVLQAHGNSHVWGQLFCSFFLDFCSPPTPAFMEILHPVVQPVFSIPKNLPLQPITGLGAVIIFPGIQLML